MSKLFLAFLTIGFTTYAADWEKTVWGWGSGLYDFEAAGFAKVDLDKQLFALEKRCHKAEGTFASTSNKPQCQKLGEMWYECHIKGIGTCSH